MSSIVWSTTINIWRVGVRLLCFLFHPFQSARLGKQHIMGLFLGRSNSLYISILVSLGSSVALLFPFLTYHASTISMAGTKANFVLEWDAFSLFFFFLFFFFSYQEYLTLVSSLYCLYSLFIFLT